MSRLTWDRTPDRIYETGTDRGVLYLQNRDGSYGSGTAWNGLTAVTENPSGGEPTALWADNIKYLNLLSTEEFGCTIEAYSYPRPFRACLGKGVPIEGLMIGQQERQGFAFCYRTLIGNADYGNDYSYKIHVIYGCKASPSSVNYTTVNDSPEAVTLSWEVTTTPIKGEGMKPTSEIVFDGSVFKKRGVMNALHAIEDILYGTDEAEARLPSLEEITEIYTYQRYMLDSDEEQLLDSLGRPLMGSVYD